MKEIYFIIPPRNNMTARTLQIQGLMIVRTINVTSFRAMKEEKKRIHRLFSQA